MRKYFVWVCVFCICLTALHFVDRGYLSDRLKQGLTSINEPAADNTSYYNINVSISVCVPAVESDIKTNLPRLFRSIMSQTVAPLEVIVVISNATTDSCKKFKESISSSFTVCKVNIYCKINLQLQSVSREEAASYAKGTVVSYMDSDDAMYPNRIEVISALYRQYNPLMVLHAFSKSSTPPTKNKWKTAPVMHGEALYKLAKDSEGKRKWLLANIIHSHLSVKRKTLPYVKFRTGKEFYRAEDSYFVRDFLYFFGRQNNTALYIDTALSWYVPRENRHG